MRVSPAAERVAYRKKSQFRKEKVYETLAQVSIPFGMLKPGKKNSPSPTPPFFRLLSLTMLLSRFLINSICFADSSAGMCLDKAVQAL